MIRKVLDFWFPSPLKLLITAPLAQVNTSAFALWFGANPDTDKSIRDSFLSDLISLANSSKLQHEMLESIEGAMAMLIIFDQFTRNIFRNTPEAFMYDSLALKTAQFICEKKWDLQMNPIYRGFAYLVIYLSSLYILTLFLFSLSNTQKKSLIRTLLLNCIVNCALTSLNPQN
jgi:uncharacterized protein (DUF924 family)